MSSRMMPQPGSHFLNKSSGNSLFCSWNARNTGDQVGNVSLQIDNSTMGIALVRSFPVSVAAGTERLVSVTAEDLILGLDVQMHFNIMVLHMIDDDTDQVVAQHSFTVVLIG